MQEMFCHMTVVRQLTHSNGCRVVSYVSTKQTVKTMTVHGEAKWPFYHSNNLAQLRGISRTDSQRTRGMAFFSEHASSLIT